jgi:hypothetical protein
LASGEIACTGNALLPAILATCIVRKIASRNRPFAMPAHVRLGLPARSRLVWLATCPSAGGQIDRLPAGVV